MHGKTAKMTAVSGGLALATCCFPILGVATATLGPQIAIAIAGGGLLCWLVSRAYGELCAMYPSGAGVRTWVGRAFSRPAGLTLALLYLFLVVSLGAAETFLISEVLAQVFPGLSPTSVVVAFIAICTVVNVAGFEPTTKLQSVLAIAIVLGAGAVFLAAPIVPAVGQTVALELTPLLAGVATVTFLFVGFEWVVNLSSELQAPATGPGGRDPAVARVLPSAMGWAIACLTLFYAVGGLALWHTVPAETLATSLTPHLVLGGNVAGQLGLFAMVVVSIIATLTSFNSGILGASRMAYALAREGALPRSLARLHPGTLAPHRAIVAIGLVTGLSALTLSGSGAWTVPVAIGAAVECVAFGFVAFAFARLRRMESGRERPYRAPYGPLVAVGLGIACLALAVGALVSAQHPVLTVAIFGAVTAVAAWWAARVDARPEPNRTHPVFALSEIPHG